MNSREYLYGFKNTKFNFHTHSLVYFFHSEKPFCLFLNPQKRLPVMIIPPTFESNQLIINLFR